MNPEAILYTSNKGNRTGFTQTQGSANNQASLTGQQLHLNKAARMWPFMVILFTLTTQTSSGQNPAIKLILTNKGLQYGKHIGSGWIQENIEGMSLPDVRGVVSLGLLGNVEYTFSSMTVSQCDVPEPVVEFDEEITGFKAGISGLSIAVRGKWNTKYGFIHDNGLFNLAIFNMDMSSEVKVGSDNAGRLSITSLYCDADIEEARINFHGGASWIFQPFVKHFQGHIKRKITERICPAVEGHVAKLEESLEAMNVTFQVDKALVLEIPLTNPPLMNASSLDLDLKGEFFCKKDPPFIAQPFELHQKEGYMLTLGLSEFTLNSASYGYYSAGLMHALINDSMIPPGSPFHLNTSYFGVLIPQLPKLFPDMLMELQVYAREVPMFSFFPGAMYLGFHGSIKAFALQTNKTVAPLFQLNADSIFSGKILISAGKLKGSMNMENFTLALISTEVGTFQTAALENVMKTGLNMEVIAKVNAKLAKGIDLPSMQHAQLVNPVLELKKGFIAISSDAEVWSK